MSRGPWTSVVSFHVDPSSCGVARFSAQLAARLGVPHWSAGEPDRWGDKPLLSVKWAEWRWMPLEYSYHDQLWHDPGPEGADLYVGRGRVWKLYQLGVPALVQPHAIGQRAALFTFGMAHKLELEHFRMLRAKVGGFELWVSSAAHEGAGPSKVPELLQLWGSRAFDLGHLSDAALSLVWPRVTAFVAFFQGGLRANNSSVHAALDARVPVITNHGEDTPRDLRGLCYDVRDLRGGLGNLFIPGGSPYTWERLLVQLGVEA